MPKRASFGIQKTRSENADIPDSEIDVVRLQVVFLREAFVRVKVRISQVSKGPQVAEVLEVDMSTAQVASRTERRFSTRSSSSPPGAVPTEECLGSVKWYKLQKGFGFVAQDRGGKDVFVHATTRGGSGLNELAEGQRVRMQISQGQKGLEARSIELLD
jgi:CspA family cold shock protein